MQKGVRCVDSVTRIVRRLYQGVMVKGSDSESWVKVGW